MDDGMQVWSDPSSIDSTMVAPYESPTTLSGELERRTTTTLTVHSLDFDLERRPEGWQQTETVVALLLCSVARPSWCFGVGAAGYLLLMLYCIVCERVGPKSSLHLPSASPFFAARASEPSPRFLLLLFLRSSRLMKSPGGLGLGLLQPEEERSSEVDGGGSIYGTRPSCFSHLHVYTHVCIKRDST